MQVRSCGFLMLSLVSSSGCMMGGGMGMGAMSGMSPTPAAGSGTAIGEAVFGSTRITLEFPAVMTGHDATLEVRLRDMAGAPISGAAVELRLHAPAGDTLQVAARTIESAPGTYQAVHRFVKPGRYAAMAVVTLGEREAGSVSVMARQDVTLPTMQSRRADLRPLAFAGAAAMMAMMLVMVAF